MIEQASLIIGDGNWAVKSDSLLGYKLIDGKYYPRDMSVVRATTGTRINAQGLVELVPYNLLSYSEAFDNGYWGKYQATIAANNITAPDGTLTADRMTQSGAGGATVYVLPFNYTNSVYTASCYFKAGTANEVLIELNVTGGNCTIYYNLSTQVISGFGTYTSANIESVGNGWYRCSVVSALVNGSGYIALGKIGNVGETIYLWGAQTVEGTVAKDYLPTTDRLDIPRIDYSTGSSALLAEPQRTNLCLYSNKISDSTWLKFFDNGGSNPVITDNYGISPDGTQNAQRIQLVRTSTANSYSYILQNITGIAGQSYTWSVWLKSLSGTPSVALSNIGGSYANIVTLSNEWERYEFTTTATGTGLQAMFLLFEALPSTSLTADFLAYGFQVEQGSYATSYIPTTSTSVTRNADVLSYSSLNSLDVTTTTNYTWFLDLGNDTIVNNFDIRLGGIGLYLIGTGSQGTQWSLYNFTALNQILSNTNITGNRKICLTYNSGVLKVFANNQLLTTYSGSITSDVLTFLMSNADNRLVLNTLAIFNTTLSDTDALNLIS